MIYDDKVNKKHIPHVIKRFNLGFGIFGVPEQCKDGKYMTFDDHRKSLVSLVGAHADSIDMIIKAHNSKIEKLDQLLAEMDDELKRKKLAYQAAINDSDYWKRQYDASVSKEISAQVKASHNWDRVGACFVVALIGWGIVLVQLVNKSFGG